MVLAFGRGRGIGTAAVCRVAAGIAVSGAGPALAGDMKLMNELLPATAGMARCADGAKRSAGGPNEPGCTAEIVCVVEAGVALWPETATAGAAVASAEASCFDLAPFGFFLSSFSRPAATCVSADFLPAPV